MAKPNEMRACVICGKLFLPASCQRNTCSLECRKKRRNKRHTLYAKIRRKLRSKVGTLVMCVICGKEFAFVKSTVCSHECKMKRKQMWRRAYKQKNLEKIRAQQRVAYYKLHDRRIASSRAYKAKNRKKLRQRAIDYSNKNRERLRVEGAAYYKKNKEKIALQTLAYKARKKEFQLLCDINAIGSVINPPTKE